MINILLYFVKAFLSFQYILIKYHVQIGLPLYTIEHSHMKGYLRLNEQRSVIWLQTNCVIYLPVVVKGATRVCGAPSKHYTSTQCCNNVISASQMVDQHCTTIHCPMLLKCWASVVNSVLTLTQHCVSVSYRELTKHADRHTFTDTFYTHWAYC